MNYFSAPQTLSYGYAAGIDVRHEQKLTLKPWDAPIIDEK